LWYAFSFFSVSVKQEDVRRELQDEGRRQREQRPSDLDHRIKIVLIECRMALPGAQALLGFQLANVFTQGFEKLPRSSQWIHFGSLLSTMICAILLIAPAQYHRIAEGGEDTEHFHKVASRFLLGALVFLAPGMAGDLLIVLRKSAGHSFWLVSRRDCCWPRFMGCGLG